MKRLAWKDPHSVFLNNNNTRLQNNMFRIIPFTLNYTASLKREAWNFFQEISMEVRLQASVLSSLSMIMHYLHFPKSVCALFLNRQSN